MSPIKYLVPLYLVNLVAVGALLVSLTTKGATAMVDGHPYTLLSLGVLSFLLGLRHGLDADHLTAIDSSIRKFLREGKEPALVGLYFSLGHSTVVAAVAVSTIFAAKLVITEEAIESWGLVATVASIVFMVAMSIVLFHTSYEILRVKDRQEMPRGLVAKVVNVAFKVVSRPWHMYLVGLVFGLSFDTASQIALYTLAVMLSATAQVDIAYLLSFPILFTLGMTLVDGTNGVWMRYVYGISASKDMLRNWNFTATLLAGLYALVIGAANVAGLAGLQAVESIFNLLTYAILTSYFAIWISALAKVRLAKL